MNIEMLDKLKPISGEHSIAKVRALLFVPQPLVKPKDVFDKINESRVFKRFARKGMIKSKHIEFSDQDTSIRDGESGFVFEEFDERGKLKSFIRVEKLKENNTLITYESRSYVDWSGFKSDFKENIDNLYSSFQFYINAVSLDYQDEFIWDSRSDIDVNVVFDSNSEFLNEKFLNSKNGSLILISQDTDGEFKSEEKTELSFNNVVKRIVVNHQYGVVRSEPILFEDFMKSGDFDRCYDKAHSENKIILGSVLSKDAQVRIGLKD